MGKIEFPHFCVPYLASVFGHFLVAYTNVQECHPASEIKFSTLKSILQKFEFLCIFPSISCVAFAVNETLTGSCLFGTERLLVQN